MADVYGPNLFTLRVAADIYFSADKTLSGRDNSR